jgi:adenosylcobinamide-GDP ribazoletransferase
MSYQSHVRSMLHAVQFLTRLPTPHIEVFDPAEFARSYVWFPLVGAAVGLVVAGAVYAGGLASPWIGALLGLVAWVWVTGALHLDGLGDVADALAGAHRTPERFLQILRDPHIGAFGVITIGLQLIAKLVLLAEVAVAPPAVLFVALPLIAAWARLGPAVWGLLVPPLAAGSGERFAQQLDRRAVAAEAAMLALVSAWAAPILVAAVLIIPAIALYWRHRVGGVTGDCLGASVEVTETMLLLLFAARMA